MKALVIYESMYGNTRDIATAVAGGLSEQMIVDLMEVNTAPRILPADVDLLVLGGPTHQFGMSRRSSREMAARDNTDRLVSSGIGIREWLDGVPQFPEHVVATTFCTVLERPFFLRYCGTAAHRYQKRMNRMGVKTVASPETFWVTGSRGPLSEGELERAWHWGRQIGSKVAAPGQALHHA